MKNRTTFSHFWSSYSCFLCCECNGKTPTKPRTFFGRASAQQRACTSNFNFTARQPDLHSLKTKLKSSVKTARKAAATSRKPRTDCQRTSSTGESDIIRGQICPFPPVRSRKQASCLPWYVDTGNSNSPQKNCLMHPLLYYAKSAAVTRLNKTDLIEFLIKYLFNYGEKMYWVFVFLKRNKIRLGLKRKTFNSINRLCSINKCCNFPCCDAAEH